MTNTPANNTLTWFTGFGAKTTNHGVAKLRMRQILKNINRKSGK